MCTHARVPLSERSFRRGPRRLLCRRATTLHPSATNAQGRYDGPLVPIPDQNASRCVSNRNILTELKLCSIIARGWFYLAALVKGIIRYGSSPPSSFPPYSSFPLYSSPLAMSNRAGCDLACPTRLPGNETGNAHIPGKHSGNISRNITGNTGYSAPILHSRDYLATCRRTGKHSGNISGKNGKPGNAASPPPSRISSDTS